MTGMALSIASATASPRWLRGKSKTAPRSRGIELREAIHLLNGNGIASPIRFRDEASTTEGPADAKTDGGVGVGACRIVGTGGDAGCGCASVSCLPRRARPIRNREYALSRGPAARLHVDPAL